MFVLTVLARIVGVLLNGNVPRTIFFGSNQNARLQLLGVCRVNTNKQTSLPTQLFSTREKVASFITNCQVTKQKQRGLGKRRELSTQSASIKAALSDFGRSRDALEYEPNATRVEPR